MNNLYSNLAKCERVVALGGGHGLGRVLSSISFLEEQLTAIVTTTDNGGSTGRVRSNHGGIAWGDLRNCLNQIITTPTVASRVFEYRFGGAGDLAGHNLGNLIFSALEDMEIRPIDGIKLVRKFLGVKANFIPMSEQPTHLAGELYSGKTIIGEVSIDALQEVPKSLFLLPNVEAPEVALKAIKKAELILLGPGSFLTSIIPPLLVDGISEAIAQSNAKVIFIDNLVREDGTAKELYLDARIAWLESLLGEKRLDGVITSPNEQSPVPSHIQLLKQDMSDDEVFYRHDRAKLTQAINDIIPLLK